MRTDFVSFSQKWNKILTKLDTQLPLSNLRIQQDISSTYLWVVALRKFLFCKLQMKTFYSCNHCHRHKF